jgi:glutamate carboxypeptidase
MTDFIEFFDGQLPAMVDLLTTLVNYETPSRDKMHVDRLTDFLQDYLGSLGASSVERIVQTDVGDGLIARWKEDAPGKPILFLCHIDTVWEVGTLAERPVRIDDEGRLYGPGAIDMKGGIVVALTAIRGLHEMGLFPPRPVWLLITTDEEIGSDHFEQYIEQYATQAGLVLIMEPALPGEVMKISRKGVAHFTIEAQGLPSHAGNAPEKGINAAIEIAYQALRLHEMNDLRHGTSVSVTMLNAGSAMNVIPEHARLVVDLRTISMLAYNDITEKINHLQPYVLGATLTVKGGAARPPMEYNARMRADFEQCQRIGKQHGLTIRGDASGGGSDGNLTAALGVSTLDGLGPDGDGLHALHEHVLLPSLPRRAALLAGILRDWEF